jgi:hypothetical protein
MIGPCRGKRGGSNLLSGYVAVIDADSSLTEKNEVVNGAPHPDRVHRALTEWNLSHCIYSTFSHGSDKGNRYRVVFPVEVKDKAELKAFSLYIVYLLQQVAEIPLALTIESYTWGNGWALPRVAFEGAEFYSAFHFGVMPDPENLVEIYQTRSVEKAPPNKSDLIPDAKSPLGLFEHYIPIKAQLEEAGYEYVCQTVITTASGRDTVAMRYRRPGSTSAPGVVLFESDDGRMRVYSHHGTDPLNNGHANDSFDVWMILNGFGDQHLQDALLAGVPIIQEQVEAELEERYPTVMEAGVKFKFGNIYTDEFNAVSYRLLDSAAFAAMLQNTPMVPSIAQSEEGRDVLKMVPRAEYWNRCHRRRMYNGIIYLPHPLNGQKNHIVEKNGALYFNLFRSWHVSNKEGQWPLLEWHLRNTICSGSEEEYEYLINWFAHFVQFPEEKPGTAVVLRGGRGWGKSLVFSEIAKQLGTHALVVGNNRLLTGNFNSHLRNKLLVVVEESFWSGSPRDRGVLQHLITDQITSYEKKNLEAEPGMSFVRVVMISNEDWVAPAASDERRYFLPKVCTASMDRDRPEGKPGHFFPQLVTEMRSGGLEAFFHHLVKYPVSMPRLRKLPETEGLQEQRRHSLDWLDRWFYTVFSDGRIRAKEVSFTWMPDGLRVPMTEVIISVDGASSKAGGHVHKGSSIDFEQRAYKILGRNSVKKIAEPGGGMAYVLPSLQECREAFDRHIGTSAEWPTAGKPDEVSRGQGEQQHVWTTH